MSPVAALLIAVVSSGLTYVGLNQAGMLHPPGGPQGISPEIKAYIDAQMKGAGAASEDLKQLIARAAEIDKKIGEMEKMKLSAEALSQKSAVIESAIADQRKKEQDLVLDARERELSHLRENIALVCSGVRVQRDKGDAHP